MPSYSWACAYSLTFLFNIFSILYFSLLDISRGFFHGFTFVAASLDSAVWGQWFRFTPQSKPGDQPVTLAAGTRVVSSKLTQIIS